MERKKTKLKNKKIAKEIIVNEDMGVKKIKEYIDDCDADELARLLGELFGGECFYIDETGNYEFTPNEFYSGEKFNYLFKQ